MGEWSFVSKYSSLLIAAKPLGSRCIFISEVINTAGMVVLMGSLLLSVNHVLCSERDWVCSVMELSGNSVQKPPHGCTLRVLLVRVPCCCLPFPPGIWLSGDAHNFVCPVLCSRPFPCTAWSHPNTCTSGFKRGQTVCCHCLCF